MHPFDFRAVLLAKHAQHVVLIHFPIALLIAGVTFDMTAAWTKSRRMAVAAYYNLCGAAISTVPVVVSGLLAWQWALEGQKLKGILLMHLVSAGASTALIWVTGWVHFRANRRNWMPLPAYRFPIEVLTVALVALTAHLGGFLSGVNI
jgi:uncharacterized membrane protein